MGLHDIVSGAWGGSGSDDENSGLPRTARSCSGPRKREVVHGALLRQGLATDWYDANPVPAFTKRDYCGAIRHELGSDASGHTLNKRTLAELGGHLGVKASYDRSTRELRRLIGGECGFEYESADGYIRSFRKGELHAVAMRAIREGHGP